MSFVLIIHDVRDYELWKKVFDDAAGLRSAAGESEYQLFRFANDANRVVHLSRWPSVVTAKAFFESPELALIRAKAGVSAPDFHYLEDLEFGTLTPTASPQL